MWKSNFCFVRKIKARSRQIAIFHGFLIILSFSGCSVQSPLPTPESTGGYIVNSNSEIPRRSDGRIIPGVGSFDIKLGMSKEALIEVLGTPLNEQSSTPICERVVLQWYRVNSDGSVEDGNGIYAYLKGNVVYEINYSSNRYATNENVSFGTPFEQLISLEKDLHIFELTLSSSNSSNGKNLIYAVDEKKGIAYELSYSPRTSSRYVGGIYVFAKDSEFQPNGCVGRDQSLRVPQ